MLFLYPNYSIKAEITPLLAIIAFTLIFRLIEKKNVELHLFDNPVKGVVLGAITGIVWLAIPVLGGVSLADDYPNLIITTFTGNEILSGGICKIEGSIIVLFVNIILIALFMFLKNKQETKQ
ncbi:MAG: hypothetical protein J1E98_02515 [Lachnospiraceae bacterium]|nr:hypothetical protein [Lachnospiraceae bacterium]